MTKEELKEILDSHKKWLNDEPGGKKADLRGADLSFADLRGANLRGANLSGAGLWIYSGDDNVWAIVRAELERKIAEDRIRRQKSENAD
jgi:hypothetical protein